MIKHGLGKAAGIFLAIALIIGCTACSQTENGGNTTDDTHKKPDVAFSHSIISDNKFESRLLGIGAEFDASWRFANNDELATANGLDEISDKSLEEALETKTFICDMMAEKKFEGGADSVTLTFPNMSSSGFGNMTEREYAEATMVGIENATAVVETVKLGSEEHASIRLIGKSSGTDYYQRMIFVSKNGYLGMITLTCVSEDDIYDIISRFYTL